MANRWGNNANSDRLSSVKSPKSLQMVTAVMKLKDKRKKKKKNLIHHIKKQMHYFANKDPSSQLWFFQWSCMDMRIGL